MKDEFNFEMEHLTERVFDDGYNERHQITNVYRLIRRSPLYIYFPHQTSTSANLSARLPGASNNDLHPKLSVKKLKGELARDDLGAGEPSHTLLLGLLLLLLLFSSLCL